MAASVSSGPNIRDVDRLVFTLFLAIVVHFVMVFTDFIAEDKQPAPSTIEITLSRFNDETPPKEYEYKAQTNQTGGGDLSDRSVVTSPEQTEEAAKPDFVTQKMSEAAQQKTDLERSTITTIGTNERKLVENDDLSREFETQAEDLKQTIMETSIEIAIQEAIYDEQVENASKRLKKKTFTALDTMAAIEAVYVEQVINKIERIGSLNYPTRNGNKLYGRPRVSISIYLDGSIREITILESSGSLVLDSKTKEIIHRAAPFGAFPRELRKKIDAMELIRTFSYHRDGISSS